MVKKDKEVATVGEQTTAVAEVAQGSWGTEGISGQDILLSKLLLMQPLSIKVVDGEAAPGDLVDSVNGTILGNVKKPVEVIPICVYKTWKIMRMNDKGKYEYDHIEPCTPQNERLEWEFEEDGHKMRRDKELNFYVLLADQAEREDAFPLVLTFRRTSMKSGQKLANHFTKAAMNKVPPAAASVMIGVKPEKNDQGNYFVYTIDAGKKTSAKALTNAWNWYQRIQNGAAKIHEAQDDEASPGSSGSASQGAHQF